MGTNSIHKTTKQCLLGIAATGTCDVTKEAFFLVELSGYAVPIQWLNVPALREVVPPMHKQ